MPTATQILLSSGNNLSARINEQLSNKFVVIVLDSASAPVPGVNVTFALLTIPQGVAGQKIVEAQPIVTDANGLAAATLKFGDTSGKYVVTATATGLTGSPVAFTAIALSGKAIVMIDDVKDYLNILTDVKNDKFFGELIDAISDEIEHHCNVNFVPRDYPDEIYNGPASRHLTTRGGPILKMLNSDMTDVQYRTSPVDPWQNLEVVDARYILLEPENPWVITIYDTQFPKGESNVKISTTKGFDPVPATVQQVCIEAVAEKFKESMHGTGRLGIQSVAAGKPGVSETTRYYELSDRHKRILNRYRRIWIG